MATLKQADAPADYQPTPAEIPILMLQGWQAARKGEPLDRTMPGPWQTGWMMYVGAHSPFATAGVQ